MRGLEEAEAVAERRMVLVAAVAVFPMPWAGAAVSRMPWVAGTSAAERI
jgi:hypothetical protein